MKPAWDKLMDEFKDSTTSLVADVDCTTDGKPLCEKHGVQGYPTIKWGDPADLKDYEGGRDFDAFKKFADENLGPTCGPDNIDLCDDAAKTEIAKFQKMEIDELDQKVEESDAKITKITDEAEKKVKGYQSKIEDLNENIKQTNQKKEDKVAAESKKMGLRFMKSVHAAKKKKDEQKSKSKKKKKKKEL
jgi:hypothetical protein